MKVSDKQQRPFEVQLTFPVQTYDVDTYGIVSNIAYMRWLEDLRLKMLRTHWSLDREIAKGCGPILASTHIEYNHPIKLFDQPVGAMWLSGLGRIRWTMHAEIRLQEKLAATATQIGCIVDLATMCPISVPEKLWQDYWEYQWRS